MATFTRTDMGMGVLTPGGISWRNHHGEFEFPPGSGNDHGESILAELDAIKDDIADHNNLTTPTSRNRRMPEGLGIWVSMHLTSTTGAANIPDDATMWGLKHRGVVLSIQLAAPGQRMSTGTGEYIGAPKNGTQTRPSPVGNIPDWDPNHSGRNFAQRILDGNYDAWIDAFAARCDAYVGLVNPATGQPNPATNLKGEPYPAYDAIIVRPWFEFNGTTLNSSMPWVNGPLSGDRARGIREFWAAWCHFVDRVRNTNGATNVHFFACFAHTSDPFRRDTSNYLPENNGGGSGTNAALRTRIQLLGIDSYDTNGNGTEGDLLLEPDPGSGWQAGDTYISAFQDFGGTAKPMLIGEWGSHLSDTSRKADCETGTANPPSLNERCRGLWIKASAEKISEFRAGTTSASNKWRALKGLFYMARDLVTDDRWGLWADTHTGYGSWSQDPDFEPADPDVRPALGDEIPGAEGYSFARFADLWKDGVGGTEYKGRGGAFFDI